MRSLDLTGQTVTGEAAMEDETVGSRVISWFGNKLVLQLRRELEEARRERDYFRGKVDRLEEKLYGLAMQPHSGPTRPIDPTPAGRKTWAQVQLESLKQQKAEHEAHIASIQKQEADKEN